MDLSKISRGLKITLISLAVAAALIVIGFLSGDMAILGNLMVIGVFICIVPNFLLRYSKLVWIHAVEEQFPNFIRSVADSVRSGMSFREAINIAAKSDFGKLTDEIKDMKAKLSWDVEFMRVLEVFSEKTKSSRMISESMEIIKESFRAGGNIAETLDAIGMNVLMLKEVEAERASMTKQHGMIMYGIFFLFMGIAIATVYIMVPMLTQMSSTSPSANTGGLSFSMKNPCEVNVIFPCQYYSMIGIFLGTTPGIGTYYVAMFFNVVVVLSIFMGLIIGQLSQNSIVAGVKHSLILLMASIAVFVSLSKLGVLPK